MNFIYRRCRAIVKAQRANYPYIEAKPLCTVVGTVMKNRRKKKGIVSDIQIAILRCDDITFEQRRGYRQAAKDFFNQEGKIVGSGSSFALYKPKKKTKQLRLL